MTMTASHATLWILLLAVLACLLAEIAGASVDGSTWHVWRRSPRTSQTNSSVIKPLPGHTAS